jgi:hypothetical protein
MDTLHVYQYTFLLYLAELLLEWEAFQTKGLVKIKTHFIFNYFSKTGHCVK